jgi:hypothetical protein
MTERDNIVPTLVFLGWLAAFGALMLRAMGV